MKYIIFLFLFFNILTAQVINIDNGDDIVNLKASKIIYMYKAKSYAIEFYNPKTNSYDVMVVDLKHKKAKLYNSKHHEFIGLFGHNGSFILDILNCEKSMLSEVLKYHKKLFNKNNTTGIQYIDYNNSKDIKIIINSSKIQEYKSSFNIKKKITINRLIINSKLSILSQDVKTWTLDDYIDLVNMDKVGFVHGKYSILIGIITFILLIISLIMLKNIVGNFKLPTISSFFMLFYLMSVVIGATVLNIFYFEYEYNSGFYIRKDLLVNMWIYAVSGLILIPSGMYLSNKLFKYNAKIEFDSFVLKQIKYINQNKLFYITIFSMIISLVILAIYINKVGFIPIFSIFQHLMPDQLAQLRSVSGNDFDGKIYRYLLFYKTLPLIFLIISFMYKQYNKKWFVLFLIILFYNIFVLIMDMQKAPLINMIILLLMTYFFIKGKIEYKKILIVAFVSIGLLSVMYIYFMGVSSSDYFQILLSPFHRTFIGSISPFFYWQLYVEKYGYLGGLSLPNPHHVFSFEYMQISKEIMSFIHPELKNSGVVGSMPVVFWGDWYINFGIKYIFISMVLFGFIIQSFDIIFIKYLNKIKTIIILSLYIYLIYLFKQYNMSSFFGIVIDVYLMVPIAILILINYFLKKETV
jgi:oligosaccharide repeat unit polymerase